MRLYAIPCTFQCVKDGPKHNGMAICSDPNTPETFIFPDGKPYVSDEIWDYKLEHFQPWAIIIND